MQMKSKLLPAFLDKSETVVNNYNPEIVAVYLP